MGLLAEFSSTLPDPDSLELRRRIWRFTRDPEVGLPSSHLPGVVEWLPALQSRLRQLLHSLQTDFALNPSEGSNRRLSRALLPAGPLVEAIELRAAVGPRLRIQTVHQVKGESIDAVLYVAKTANVESMLAGVDSEVGRIGYVALTRARNLFWLAVPTNALARLRPRLLESGLKEIGLAH